MVYIDAVHYDTNSHGCEVITELKWTTTLSEKATETCTKQVMINFINENPNITKTKYLNSSNVWTIGEDVRVVDDAYLRTDSNNIKKTISVHCQDFNSKRQTQHCLLII